VLEKIKEQESL
jgi:hypothetical protein